MREMKKGSLQLLLLHLLYERPGYGYDLCERVRQRSGGTLSFEDGTVYPVLHSFEQDGLVEGYWEQPMNVEAAERRGPRRRYYRLTPIGVEALRQALSEWQTFRQGVEQIIGEGGPELHNMLGALLEQGA